jgi:predicted nucleic acid-binding protein
MAVYFLDSSALVKRYRHQAGSEQLAILIDAAERSVIARLAHVEVSAAIVRRGRAAGASAHEIDAVHMLLDRDVNNAFDVVELMRLFLIGQRR